MSCSLLCRGPLQAACPSDETSYCSGLLPASLFPRYLCRLPLTSCRWESRLAQLPLPLLRFPSRSPTTRWQTLPRLPHHSGTLFRAGNPLVGFVPCFIPRAWTQMRDPSALLPSSALWRGDFSPHHSPFHKPGLISSWAVDGSGALEGFPMGQAPCSLLCGHSG